MSTSGLRTLRYADRVPLTLLAMVPVDQMEYTAARGPMALDTSLAPCVKDMTHAEKIYDSAHGLRHRPFGG